MINKANSQPISLALIGAGIFARDAHIPSLQNLGNQFDIVAIYSRTKEGAAAAVAILEADGNKQVDVYTDVDALLAREDIEAVNVVLPIPIMVPFIEKAHCAHLRNGSAVDGPPTARSGLDDRRELAL